MQLRKTIAVNSIHAIYQAIAESRHHDLHHRTYDDAIMNEYPHHRLPLEWNSRDWLEDKRIRKAYLGL